MKDVNKESKEGSRKSKAESRKPVDLLEGIETVVFDLDGTLYNKRGLAQEMVGRLWWCLPLLLSERLARRNMHYIQYASAEDFYGAFFSMMARGHWWGPQIAGRWYHSIYMPAMVRLIAKYHPPRPEALVLLDECRKRGICTAIYSDYGGVTEKLTALGIDSKQFTLLVAAPELGALKPSEPCARRVMEMLQADPKTTLFVGDREEKDGVSAKHVGARFLLIEN